MADSRDGKGHHTRSIERARDVQRTMLPDLPHAKGLEFAAEYRTSERLGGDFYDFIRIDERHLGIAVADVSGQGAAAALMMASTKKALQICARGCLSPLKALSEVNEAIRADLPREMFVTILYAILDTQTHRITWVSAGHHLPSLLRRGVADVAPGAAGPALGLFPSRILEGKLAEHSLQLEPGDMLLLYTDGLLLAADRNGNTLGREKLHETMRQSGKAAELLTRLARTTDALRAGTPLTDDETLVAIRVEGAPETALTPPVTVAPTWLPEYRTPLIGRERDVEALLALLTGKPGTVVTLTGPAGVGKTRLAIHVAARARDHFKGGVCYVELQAAKTVADICRRVANVLHLGQEDASLGYRVGVALGNAPGPILLLLDNCEGCTKAVARCVEEWRQRAPGVCVIATSRAQLDLPGESSIAVKPLMQLSGTRKIRFSLEEARALPAVMLFAEFARREDPGFAITDSNYREVVEICQRLDGIPHAIELAAVRAGLLSPRQIIDRLDERLDLLRAEGEKGTLRGALAWSYELLDETERAAAGMLACCPDGFGPDVAAELLKALAPAKPPELLQRLSRHSLLYTDAIHELENEPRYALFETFRLFMLEKLKAAGQLDATRRRQEAALLGYALRWWSTDKREGHVQAEERLRMEAAGLEEISRSTSLPEARATATVMLAPALQTQGETQRATEMVLKAHDGLLPGCEEWHWLKVTEAELKLASSPEETERLLSEFKGDGLALCHANILRGRALMQLGRMSDSARCFTAAMNSGLLGAINGARVNSYMSTLYERIGRHREAHACLESALKVCIDKKYRELHVRLLIQFGQWHQRTGDPSGALPHFTDAIRIAQDRGMRVQEAQALAGLAGASNLIGERHQAEAAIQRSIRIAREAGSPGTLAKCLNGAANVYFEQGRVQEALNSCVQARDVAREFGDRVVEAVAESNIAAIKVELGDSSSALESLKQAYQTLLELKDLRTALGVLSNIGEVHAIRWRADRDKKDLLAATDALQRACTERRRLGFDPLINGEVSLAELLLESGKKQEAKTFAQQALDAAAHRGDQYGTSLAERARKLLDSMVESSPAQAPTPARAPLPVKRKGASPTGKVPRKRRRPPRIG